MIDFKLYVITDRQQCGDRSLVDVVKQACESGIRAVQLREKDLSPKGVFELALELRPVLDQHNTYVFINDRADIARAVGASGVHLTERSMPANEARKCLPERSLVGVSTHTMESAVEAEDVGADFITFGPVFFTPSKAIYGPPVGLKKLEEVCERVAAPVFAIGGMNPGNAKVCIDAGAYGVAVISAIMGAENVQRAVKDFERALGQL